MPAVLGVGSENAAHRFGVEWDEDGETRSGVYVPRRDTSSRLTARVGDRSFGRHSHASFAVEEDDGRYAVTIENPDDGVSMRVAGREADRLPEDSVFDDLEAASRYHECGSIGYSPRPDDACLAGVEFATDDWRVTPLAVDEVAASYLDDTFRDDAVAFDNALLMRDVDHEWIPRPPKPSSTS